MNNTNCITYGKIFKRYKCLNNIKSFNNNYNPSRILENVESQISRKTNDRVILNLIQKGINEVSNSYINESGMGYITKLIGFSNDIDYTKSSYFINEVCNNVIPNIFKDRLDQAKIDIEESSLVEEQKEKLLSSIKEASIIDRILNNHETISKRFTFDTNRIDEARDLSTMSESICTMIDTYDIPVYQKLNLSLEEMTYLLGKNGVEYNKSDLVSECTRYYLLSSPTLSDKDISNIRSTLNESYCITNEDIDKVSFIFEEELPTDTVDDYINNYLLLDNKNLLGLFNMITTASQYTRDEDFLYNSSKLFKFFYDAYLADMESYNKTKQVIKSNFDATFAVVKSYISIRADRTSVEYLSTLRKNIGDLYNQISEKYNHIIDNNRRDITEYYLESLKDIIEHIDNLLTTTYPSSNVSAYEYITRENANHISLKEAEEKKYPGLLKSVFAFNAKSKEKSKQFAQKIHAKFKEFPRDMKRFIIGENSVDTFASLITEDHRMDINVMQIELEDYSYISEIHKFFTSLCEEYNRLASDKVNGIDARAYYEINGSIVEVHIGEASIIDISSDDIIFNDLSDPVLLSDVNNLNEMASYCDYIMENLNEISNINKYLSTKINECDTPLSIEEYEIALEALSIMNTPKESIELFTEKYIDSLADYVTESGYSNTKYIYNTSRVRVIEENYKPYAEATIEEYALCTGILSSILEKKDDSLLDKDRKLGEDIKKKNPLKGINFNGIKLVLQGIKNKFKNLSTKEKELSTKLDNNFKNFVSSIKKASVDKKREQIIKNDVVPSLSKCIKTGVLLAGVGIFGNPILAAALAIGSFAANRKITAKEKTLICDEIETELQVIDREIANADARNQTKRYRALLTQKKALQREYQRIKYNKNIGKKFYVSPNAGTQVES